MDGSGCSSFLTIKCQAQEKGEKLSAVMLFVIHFIALGYNIRYHVSFPEMYTCISR